MSEATTDRVDERADEEYLTVLGFGLAIFLMVVPPLVFTIAARVIGEFLTADGEWHFVHFALLGILGATAFGFMAKGFRYYSLGLTVVSQHAYKYYKLTIPGDNGDKLMGGLFLIGITGLIVGAVLFALGHVSAGMWFLVPGAACLLLLAFLTTQFVEEATTGFSVTASCYSIFRASRWILHDVGYVLCLVGIVLFILKLLDDFGRRKQR